MKDLERRVTRLENHQGACNHPAYGIGVVVLKGEKDEALERITKELAECPRCRRKGIQPYVMYTNVNFDA
jgi:hypothetical protein